MSAPTSPTLFDIERVFQLLDIALADAEENDGDLDAIAAAWFDALGKLEQKAAGVVGFAKMQERLAAGFDAMAKASDAEAKRLRGIAAARRARAARLNKRLMDTMAAAGARRLETTIGAVCVQKNSSSALIVDDVDPLVVQVLHPDLVVTSTTINNDAVSKMLDAGVALPFARYAPRGEHIRIR